jgi:hypothetical protein
VQPAAVMVPVGTAGYQIFIVASAMDPATELSFQPRANIAGAQPELAFPLAQFKVHPDILPGIPAMFPIKLSQ